MEVLGIIADHPTPKISTGEITYTMESRDYKGVMIVVILICNASDRTIQGIGTGIKPEAKGS